LPGLFIDTARLNSFASLRIKTELDELLCQKFDGGDVIGLNFIQVRLDFAFVSVCRSWQS